MANSVNTASWISLPSEAAAGQNNADLFHYYFS
jgi:hypothetical protein